MLSVQPISPDHSKNIGELTNELRLMMYFARVSLEPKHRDLIHQTASKIQDWDRFATKATWHYVTPLCLYHLKHLKGCDWHEPARAALLPSARALAAKSLRAGAANKAFLTDLKAHNVLFLIVKGRAVGSRYYPDPSLRLSRDIDIWAHPSHRVAIIERAQLEGHVTYPFGRTLNADELAIHIEKHQADIGLIHPNGTKIELDLNLDKNGEIFKFDQMLERAEPFLIDGVECQTLSTTDCFIYCCLHHARHGFLRLIWLADLDAIQRAPDFDLEHVRVRAQELGLDRTVEACLTLYKACQTEDPVGYVEHHPEAWDVMNTCIAVSDFHHASEVREFMSRSNPDYLYEWQYQGREIKSPTERFGIFLTRQMMRFRPTLKDYETLPLPMSLYYVYYLLRPWFVLARKAGILKP